MSETQSNSAQSNRSEGVYAVLDVVLFYLCLFLDFLDYHLTNFMYWWYGREEIVPWDMKKENHLANSKISMQIIDPTNEEHLQNTSKNSSAVIRRRRMESELFQGNLLDGKIQTINDLFERSVTIYRNRRFHGTRRIQRYDRKKLKYRSSTQPVNANNEWMIPVFENQVKWETYEDVYLRSSQVGFALNQWIPFEKDEKLAIYLDTCQEWFLMAHACLQYDIKIVTVYANLGEEAVIQALQEAEVKALFVGDELLPSVPAILKQCPTIQYIIYKENIVLDEETENQKKRQEFVSAIMHFKDRKIQIQSFQELENTNVHVAVLPKRRPTNDSLALIMYTSGTTGKPKGVMITHGNVLSTIRGLDEGIGVVDNVSIHYVGYLPLAHILEFVAEHMIMWRGGDIGYGSPKTLTDLNCKPSGDFRCFAPTILVGVPKVFSSIMKIAHETVAKMFYHRRYIFKHAYEYKFNAMKQGRETVLYNNLVFRRFKSIVGGNLIGILSGGASLSKEVHEFCRIALGCSFIQGYGLTESCAAATVFGIFDPFETDKVGAPLPSVELKLVDVPEMNYFSTSNPPRGEIAIRGTSVCHLGYYKQPELTKEVFHEDGWFYTGDIGMLLPDNGLRIIDRKKNLLKLAQGEYIATEKLQSIFEASPFAEPNGIFVHGKATEDYLIAIICVRQPYVKEYAVKHGIMEEDIKKLIRHPTIIKGVLESLNKVAEMEKLKRFEYIKNVHLVDDIWEPENGFLTAAQKLKRNYIAEYYKQEIDNLYKKLE